MTLLVTLRRTLIARLGKDTLSGGVGNDTLLATPADAGADGLFGDADIETCASAVSEGDTQTTCEAGSGINSIQRTGTAGHAKNQ